MDLADYEDLAPSGDYALNSFLIEISDTLTDEDLKKLKFLCGGKYGIGKARLEQIDNALELFVTLRERDLLNKRNLITLQAMLWVLPRRDLQQKYVEFAESLGSSIHFVVPRETPENGYRYIKFHIKGGDLNTYDRFKLEKTRSLVASLLNVPPEFVIVSGIEPSSSLMITIMLLEDDAQRLASSSPEALSVLSDMFVDYIKIGTKTIPVSAATKPDTEHKPADSAMEKELSYVLFKQSQTEMDLNRANAKIFKLRSKLTSAKSTPNNIGRLFYMLAVLIHQINDHATYILKLRRLVEDQAFNPIDKLQKLCVFTYFRHCLKKVRELGYNEAIIYNLLDAQALVFQRHIHERGAKEIATLRMQLAFTLWEKEKLAFYHRLGVQDNIMSKREEFYVSAVMQNLPLEIGIGIKSTISLECVEHVFRRLSQDVTDSELKILNKKHKIKGQPAKNAYDYITATYQQRASQPQGAELRSFVRDVLAAPLNRIDLLQKLDRYVAEFHTISEKTQSSGVKREGSSSSPLDPHAEILQKINERLCNIEKNLQQRESSPFGKFSRSYMKDDVESILTNPLICKSFLNGSYDSKNPLGFTQSRMN